MLIKDFKTFCKAIAALGPLPLKTEQYALSQISFLSDVVQAVCIDFNLQEKFSNFRDKTITHYTFNSDDVLNFLKERYCAITPDARLLAVRAIRLLAENKSSKHGRHAQYLYSPELASRYCDMSIIDNAIQKRSESVAKITRRLGRGQ